MRRSLNVFAIAFLLVSMAEYVRPVEAAEEFTDSEVRTAVETWVRYVTADARPDAVVERMEPYAVDGTLVGYIVHLQDGGFCLASANSLLLPVYLYSPAGSYDPTNPGYQYILWEMADRLQYLADAQAKGYPDLQAYQSELARRATVWQYLINGRIPPKVKGNEAVPIHMRLDLTSRWGQGSPYNDLTPNLTPGRDERAKTGCVATAIAQVMNYWQWPHHGTGIGSVDYHWRFRENWDETTLANNPNIPSDWRGGERLRWISYGGGRLQMKGYWDDTLYEEARDLNSSSAYRSALVTLWNRLTQGTTSTAVDFGHTTYHWELLQDEHVEPVDPGDVEVAALMLHVGVATGMDYGLLTSGVSTINGEHALQEHFGYDSDVYYALWPTGEDMLPEIQWLRPFVLRGQNDNGGGHAWVVLGYDTSDDDWQFLMNFGWNGTDNDWYTLDEDPPGYPNWRGYLAEIAPRDGVKFVGAGRDGDGSPDDPYGNIQEALNEAPSGSTLIFTAGFVNEFSSTSLTINRPFILKGQDIVIRKR